MTTQDLVLQTDARISKTTKLLNSLRFLNARRRAKIAAKHGVSPTPGKPPKVIFGLDYAEPVTNTNHIHSIGARFVCRYLASHPGFHNSKDLTPNESLVLGKSGIGRVVVWETTANRAADGHAAGVQDAENAKREATACHMPSGRPIYFAVDFAANPASVIAYFEGVAAILGKGRTGVYGSYYVVKELMLNGLCQWGWQTYAWSNGLWFPRAQIQQYSNDHVLNGVGVDFDRAMFNDYGQW